MEKTYYVFNETEIGHNHVKADKICEDWSGSHQNELINLCIVADGHGSDNYPRTDRGSRFAVQATMNCVVEFIEEVDSSDLNGTKQNEILSQLAKSILRTWYGLVESDFEENPILESELANVSEKYKKAYLSRERIEKAYGTTLIAYAITKDFSFGIQIGDGKCVVIDEKGDFSTPIPDDPDCQLNVTTSICDSDAIDEFRFCFTEKPLVAVFCGSDGIEDSYSSIDQLYALYRSIASIFAEHGAETGVNEVREYLPVLTKKGSGDDVSIAGIVNVESIKQMKTIFDLQINLFKVSEEMESIKHRILTLNERVNSLKEKIITDTNRNQRMGITHRLEDEVTSKRKELDKLVKEVDELAKRKEKLDETLKNFLENKGKAIFANRESTSEIKEVDEQNVDDSSNQRNDDEEAKLQEDEADNIDNIISAVSEPEIAMNDSETLEYKEEIVEENDSCGIRENTTGSTGDPE